MKFSGKLSYRCHICMYMSTCMRTCVRMCVHLWASACGGQRSMLVSSVTDLYFILWDSLSPNLAFTDFAWVAGQYVPEIPISAFLVLGLQTRATMTSSSTWVLRHEVRSSCLYGKLFSDTATLLLLVGKISWDTFTRLHTHRRQSSVSSDLIYRL